MEKAKSILTIIKIDDRYLIYSQHKTDKGVWLEVADNMVLDTIIEKQQLGDLILNELNKNRPIINYPENMKSYKQAFHKKMKIKLNRKNMLKSKLIEIELYLASIEIIPFFNNIVERSAKFNNIDKYFSPLEGYFTPIEENVVSLQNNIKSDKLGKKIVESFTLCK